MIDCFVLGTSHLYAKPAYGNLKECNKTRDSESLRVHLHGVMLHLIRKEFWAAVTCIIGLQFGHILIQMQSIDTSIFINFFKAKGEGVI
ncbi:uncharacterized protein LOC141600137 isoform X2 [Silene latifolia]|uniref:uncharacterized protein LOC141600137 isoform X2 n=1 Tax=Silene latifolia TaxID=37657 RepID=UPI003D780D2B